MGDTKAGALAISHNAAGVPWRKNWRQKSLARPSKRQAAETQREEELTSDFQEGENKPQKALEKM